MMRRRSTRELLEKSARRKRSLRRTRSLQEEIYPILIHTPNLSASGGRQRWRNWSRSTRSVWINKPRSKRIIRTVIKLGERRSGRSRRSTRQRRKGRRRTRLRSGATMAKSGARGRRGKARGTRSRAEQNGGRAEAADNTGRPETGEGCNREG